MLQKGVLILAFTSLTGCAFTQLKVTPPQSELTTSVKGGNGRAISVVVPMEDGRAIRNRCGTQKNGYNMETANVLCTEEPTTWLPNLLRDGLKKAGFNVTSDRTSPQTLVVQGNLRHFFVEPKVGFFTFTPEADIEIKLSVTNEAGLLAERNFYIKAEEVSLVGVESNVQKASDKATNDIVNAMVASIVELNKQYPN